MNHPLHRIVALCGLFLLAGPPVWADDEIRYYDRAEKKEAKVAGRIQSESPAGIKIRPARENNDKLIPASDIREVIYQVDAGLAIEHRSPFGKEYRAEQAARDEERKKLLQEAVAGYRDLLPRLGSLKNAQRYVQFRAALVLARLAEEDPQQVGPAIDALTKFQTEHPDSWEISFCVKALGRLQEEKGDLAAARKTYESLARRKDVPEEARQECGFLVVRALMTAGQHDEARKQLEELGAAVAKDESQAARVQVYLIRCQVAAGKADKAEAQLKTVVAGNADAAVKAMACTTLADFYRRNNRLEDAFWQYLWVDVIYNQDREEHAEALYHLAKLFDQVKQDPSRARQCQERLVKEKEFVGTKYQKLAARETREK